MIAAASSRAEASALPRVATVIALAVCVLTAVAHVAYDAGQRRARAGGEARAGQAAADWGAHARAAAEVAGVATPGRPRGVGRALNITESDLMAMGHYVFYLDEPFKLILTCLPKVGSTETVKLILRMAGEPKKTWRGKISSARVHGIPQRKDHLLSRLSPAEAQRRLLDPEYTRAVLVRDPLERLLSAYLDKIVGQRAAAGASRSWWDMNKTVNSYRLRPGRAKPTFHEFATWASASPWPAIPEQELANPLGYNPYSAHPFVPWGPRPPELKYYNSESNPLNIWDPRYAKRLGDPHWRGQAHLAGLHKTAALYDYIIPLDKAQEGMRALLEGLPGGDAWERFGASGWGTDGNLSFMEKAGDSHTTDAHRRLHDAYNNDIDLMNRVAATYWEDYVTFSPHLQWPEAVTFWQLRGQRFAYDEPNA